VLPLEGSALEDLPGLPAGPLYRPPWWVVLLGGIVVVAVTFAVLGQWNSERYYLVCSADTAEAHRGRGFPWPFGHSALEGLRYRPVPVGKESLCHTHEVETEEALRQALLRIVVAEAQRLGERGRTQDLDKVRQLVQQARLLGGGDPALRKILTGLEADLYLHEGRGFLRDTEEVLRRAQVAFEKARSLGGPQHRDVSLWIRLVEELVAALRRGLAADAAAGAGSRAPRPDEKVTPPVAPRPLPAAPAPDAGAPPRSTTPLPTPGPDAGVGGGILL
jgi:hypothetical protein